MNTLQRAAAGLALIAALPFAPAHAGVHSKWPGELVMPTTPTRDAGKYVQPQEFVYVIVWCSVTVDGRRVPANALVPADLPGGVHLNRDQAATRFWATRQHFGIFDTMAHAAAHARWLYEHHSRHGA